jgi:antitoxin YefM
VYQFGPALWLPCLCYASVEESEMAEINQTYARDHFDELLAQVIDDAEVIVIQREDGNDVAMISAVELSSMQETLYVLSSRTNARRLFDAMDRVDRGEGEEMTLDELAARVGLDLKPAK